MHSDCRQFFQDLQVRGGQRDLSCGAMQGQDFFPLKLGYKCI